MVSVTFFACESHKRAESSSPLKVTFYIFRADKECRRCHNVRATTTRQ